ncbi:MAG: response regulator transcription factor [Gammaproteobacteria bacterium]|nr:MAG: response regulator transcription factor [Gammaproteobacteria bacterium]
MNRVLVVDDEIPNRERLVRMVEQQEGYCVVAQAGNGRDAIALCHEHDPNIVLMDITMPGMDGLTAARFLSRFENPPAVIFCTAHDEYALKAFELQAVGYLVKPVSAQKLSAALAQAARLTRDQIEAVAREQDLPRSRSHIMITRKNGIELLPVSDIRCFRADQKYVEALYPAGEALLTETLKELEDEFPDHFVRVHRNALVSLAHIEAIERDEEGQDRLRLQGIEWRPVISRRQMADLKRRLSEL